jgi:outer membrane protein assembly factor BamB
MKPLRLWPGVVIALLLLLLRFAVPVVAPDETFVGVFGGIVCALAIFLWWLFLSRAPWSERLGAVILTIVGLFATSRIIEKSLATGAQGFLFPFLAIPVLGVALVAWAVASRRLPDGLRRATMVTTILLTCGVWALVRTGGFTAATFKNDLHWRWTQTPEERLLARSGNELGGLPAAPSVARTSEKQTLAQPASKPAVPAILPPREAPKKQLVAKSVNEPRALPVPAAVNEMTAEWPGFRGPLRDGIVRGGLRIKTDWKASPPVALWRRPIGPGWSSFAIRGDLLYTQEQRGPDEVVACYELASGKPVWAHRDAARFWESNGGPGPRGTPTLGNGRVYTFGATGILNVLNGSDGAVVWSRNAAADAAVKTPGWGFASSPLVVGDLVIVAAAGKLVAYDLATGTPRWFGPDGGDSYSSPHLVTIGGVTQIVLMSAVGATSVAPTDGSVLWKHSWPSDTRIMQPAVTSDGDLLITGGDAMGGVGMRRIAVAYGPAGWTTEERWTSTGLKPGFNDSVVHDGHAFGFDGSILACINVKDGKRTWKGGRYGNGQFVLLAGQDLLLVVSEEGDLALVKATPDQFTELARVPAIEGKTWGHPALVGDVLLVRNGEEMAAFRLAREGS